MSKPAYVSRSKENVFNHSASAKAIPGCLHVVWHSGKTLAVIPRLRDRCLARVESANWVYLWNDL